MVAQKCLKRTELRRPRPKTKDFYAGVEHDGLQCRFASLQSSVLRHAPPSRIGAPAPLGPLRSCLLLHSLLCTSEHPSHPKGAPSAASPRRAGVFNHARACPLEWTGSSTARRRTESPAVASKSVANCMAQSLRSCALLVLWKSSSSNNLFVVLVSTWS